MAGSLLALAAVRPWARLPLWGACLSSLAVAGLRGLEARRLRGRLGPRVVALHPSDRWLSFDAHPGFGQPAWSFDLGAPLVPRAPLLAPGLLFVIWVGLQLVPLPGPLGPGTLSRSDTLRGLGFVAAGLALHLAAAACFAEREPGRRFRRRVAAVGGALALAGLAQAALGTVRLYGLFEPLEAGAQLPLGPFVNRNHFAGYMLLVIPLSLGVFSEALDAYRARIGARSSWRRILLNLGTPQGAALLYVSLPPLLCLAGLVVSTSRGALLAAAVTAPVVLVCRRRREAVLFLGLLFALAAVTLGAYGLERLEARFQAAGRDRQARVAVWSDALQRMEGYWLRGSGLNTFAWAHARARPFELPAGATPWPRELLTPPRSHEREWPAFRVPPGTPGSAWFREAHNDYLQLLVETGLPGLLAALWGAARVLRAARPDPWLLAALLALMAHESVDFSLQIPAIAVLFASLGGLRPLPGRSW